MISSQSHVPLISHFSFTPEWDEDINGRPATGHLQNSPRNLLVYYFMSQKATDIKARVNMISLLRQYPGNEFCPENVDMSNALPQPKRQEICSEW